MKTPIGTIDLTILIALSCMLTGFIFKDFVLILIGAIIGVLSLILEKVLN